MDANAGNDAKESMRRTTLFGYVLLIYFEQTSMFITPSVLEGIKDELEVLSDHSSAAGYQENDTDTRAVSELAQDLRDAILDHQVCTELGTLDHTLDIY